MKQFLLILTLVTFSAKAQITITEDDLPKAGDGWRLERNAGTSLTITAPGSNAQTWNFTPYFGVLDSGKQVYQPASSLYYNQFIPNAEIGIDFSYGANFYRTDANGFYCVGQTLEGLDSVVSTAPEQLMMPAGFTYGNTRVATGKYIHTVYFQSGEYQKHIYTITDTFYADAWGTVTTPYFNNVPCLRVKHSYTTSDSVYTSPNVNGPFTGTGYVYNQRNYMFVKKGHPYIAFGVDIYPNGLTGIMTFMSIYVPTPVDVVKPVPVTTTVAPNPASASNINIRIEGKDATLLKIYNLAGQCLLSENVTGLNNVLINNNGLTRGIYLCHITDNKGNVIGENKFVVK